MIGLQLLAPLVHGDLTIPYGVTRRGKIPGLNLWAKLVRAKRPQKGGQAEVYDWPGHPLIKDRQD